MSVVNIESQGCCVWSQGGLTDLESDSYTDNSLLSLGRISQTQRGSALCNDRKYDASPRQ